MEISFEEANGFSITHHCNAFSPQRINLITDHGSSVDISPDGKTLECILAEASTEEVNDHDHFFTALKYAKILRMPLTISVSPEFGSTPLAAERKLIERL